MFLALTMRPHKTDSEEGASQPRLTRSLTSCLDSVAHVFTSKTATMVFVIGEGVPDPNAPPPYELKHFPESGIGGTGPVQYTLQYRPIPEQRRAKPTKGSKTAKLSKGEGNLKGLVQAAAGLVSRSSSKPKTTKTARDSTCSESIQADEQLLSVLARATRKPTKPADEGIDDKAWLNLAMSVLFPDLPRGQWTENDEMTVISMLLDVGPGEGSHEEEEDGSWDGANMESTLSASGMFGIGCLSPIVEEDESEEGVMAQVGAVVPFEMAY